MTRPMWAALGFENQDFVDSCLVVHLKNPQPEKWVAIVSVVIGADDVQQKRTYTDSGFAAVVKQIQKDTELRAQFDAMAFEPVPWEPLIASLAGKARHEGDVP